MAPTQPLIVHRLVLAFFVLGVANAASADMCVRVDIRFAAQKPSLVLRKAIYEEVAAIWAPYGVRIQRADESTNDRCEQLDGSFDVSVGRPGPAPTMKAGAVVLGSTHLPLGTIDHVAVRVDDEATTEVLRSLPVSRLREVAGHPTVQSLEIGRALGRILAHELGHVLLALPQHQPQGLMRPSYTPEDLVSLQRSSFTLSAGELLRLRQREHLLGMASSENATRGDPFP